MTVENTTLEIPGTAGKSAEPKNALQREWELLTSLGSTVVEGFEKRVKDAGDHKFLTTVEVVGSFVAGAAMTFASARGGYFALASEAAGWIFGIGAIRDVYGRLHAPMADTWNNPGHLEQDKKILGNNVGSALFDYPLMAVSGGLGAAGGFKFGFRGITALALDAHSAPLALEPHPTVLELPPHTPAVGEGKFPPENIYTDGKLESINYRDAEGKIIAEHFYNKKGKLERKKTYSYDTDMKLTTENEYGASGDLIRKKSYIYDSEGKVKSYELCNRDGELITRGDYTYHANGELTIEKFGRDGKFKGRQTYDEADRLISREYWEGDRFALHKESYTYNSQGKKIGTDEYIYHQINIDGDPELFSNTTYDEDHNPIRERFYNDDGTINVSHEITYKKDARGKITSEESNAFDSEGKLFATTIKTYNTNGKPASTVTEYYNAERKVTSTSIKKYDVEGKHIITEDYDAEQKLTSKSIKKYDVEGKHIITEDYDAEDRLRLKSVFNDKGKKIYAEKYNDKGKIEASFNYFDNEIDIASSVHYIYTADGKIITTEINNANPYRNEPYKKIETYDANDNLMSTETHIYTPDDKKIIVNEVYDDKGVVHKKTTTYDSKENIISTHEGVGASV